MVFYSEFLLLYYNIPLKYKMSTLLITCVHKFHGVFYLFMCTKFVLVKYRYTNDLDQHVALIFLKGRKEIWKVRGGHMVMVVG